MALMSMIKGASGDSGGATVTFVGNILTQGNGTTTTYTIDLNKNYLFNFHGCNQASWAVYSDYAIQINKGEITAFAAGNESNRVDATLSGNVVTFTNMASFTYQMCAIYELA